MPKRLHLSSNHRAMIETLLRELLPGVEVWAYGSRVNGRSHDGSDLDLVLRGPGLKEIPAGQVRNFVDAVRDSTIPFLVEVREWSRLNERFHGEIERGYVVLVEKDKYVSSDEGWVSLRLGELCTKIGSGATPRGGKEVYLNEGPCSLIRSQNVYNNRFSRAGLVFITERMSTELNNVEVLPGDVLLNITGDSVARACQVPPDVLPARVNQHVAILRPDASKLSARFLRYFLVSPRTQTLLLSWARSGGTRNALTKGMIESLDICAPADVTVQRSIAHILGTLDDKIELNRRMNETLEAMARALFKSWFVDFDPVRAKAALRTHAAQRASGPITPPLRGSRGGEGASPKSSRWGDTSATQPPRPWPEIKRRYTSTALHHAQAMRQNQTNAEVLLWYYLRKKQLGGYKFRRQQPMGAYIADFACLPEKLLIELDGGQHADPDAPDEQRDQFLRQQGYRVLRFWNHEVFADCFSVLERVYEALTDPPPPQPAPDGLASATPPQGGSDWSVERARAYLSGMDPAIAALFPDHFVDSELGEIPAGWEIKEFHELADVSSGKRPPVRLPTASNVAKVPVWGGNGPMAFTSDPLIDQTALITGRVGTLGSVFRVTSACWPSDNTLIVKPRYGQAVEFLFFLMQRIDFDALNRGSTQPLLTQTDLKAQRSVTSSSTISESFGAFAAMWFARLDEAEQESRRLSMLRDTLLPKLISGEIRLSEAEKAMEGVI